MKPKTNHYRSTDILLREGPARVWAYRLRRDESDAVTELILKKCEVQPDDDPEAVEQKERRYRDFQAFRTKNLDYEEWAERDSRIITYEMLPELLKLADISYAEYLEYISIDPNNGEKVPLGWPREEEAELCRSMDALSREQREKLFRFALDFASRNTIIMFHSGSSAIKKLIAVDKSRQEKFRQPENVTAEKISTMAYKRVHQKYSETALPMKYLLYYAKRFDVSPHWLLGLKEDVHIYSQNPTTEAFMDLYCLLSRDRQRILEQVARAESEGCDKA